jgi:hypothetical protein
VRALLTRVAAHEPARREAPGSGHTLYGSSGAVSYAAIACEGAPHHVVAAG